MHKLSYFIPLAALLIASCHSGEKSGTIADTVAMNAITEQGFVEAVKTLSSDAFEGRLPFTAGEEKTVNYIADAFKKLGLTPGNGQSYFQDVPIVEVTSTPATAMTFSGTKGSVGLQYLNDYVLGSYHQQPQIKVDNSDLVFAGFGIVAPEYHWNDYDGLDVKGKTVVVLVNDPGHYDKSLFKGDTMTYYGRWTYKFEEAARQGATGILIVHETGAASYGWNVVRTGWVGPQMTLQDKEKGMGRCSFEGWLTGESASKLFKLAGLSDTALLSAATKPGFKAVDLQLKTSVSIKNTYKESLSKNVLAKLPGAKRPEETIIYTAHWDHLGIGEPLNGDSIYNGALDNATGVAGLLEIAKAFKASPIPPDRSIVFLMVTGEEQGLLGSRWYAEHPVYPLKKTVADINIDMLSPLGKTSNVSVEGLGQSDMDDYIASAAKRQGRTINAPSNPSSGGFYRSDHFNFAKVGVPALYAGSGNQLVEKDSTKIKSLKKQLEGIYHTQKDEFNDHWQLDGMIGDLRMFYDVGYRLSMEKTFPKWKTGSEFKAIREK
ncbi:Zn-dependent amino-or carboxypeptidase, M28 family [bacterium A37T11]|nr:Zn-dependent amino-or carboxypeptidase, M28 family [bacterium A37T11]